MRQSRFEETYRAEWEALDELLTRAEAARNPAALAPEERAELEELPAQYRRLCRHYSLALRRCYTSGLSARLHDLVLRGHRLVHQSRSRKPRDIMRFLHFSFPRRTRQAKACVFLSLALFLLPALTLGRLCYLDPTFILNVMPAQSVLELESMYRHGIDRPIRREAATEFAMFGHYIRHNIGIGFRTFAGGLALGLGAALVLIHNGVILGAAAGHLSHPPFAAAFWTFVPGHSAWELTAIVLCGAAGLMLGASLLRAGPLRRLDSLRETAPQALTILLGAALMLVIAAAIEAFWSARVLPPACKYGFAAANWILVLAYLCGSGHAD